MSNAGSTDGGGPDRNTTPPDEGESKDAGTWSTDAESNPDDETRFQTRTNDDPSDWSCLSDVEWASASSENLEYTGRAATAFGDEAMSGVEFEICPNVADVSCSDPVVTGTTDGEGQFTGTIPTGPKRKGFDGYARVTGTSSTVDTLIFFNPPITENQGAPVSVPMLSSSTFDALSNAVMGLDPDPERGHLALEALDCTWRRTAGVTFEIDTADGESTELYMNDGMPTASTSKTDATGLGGFFNVSTGDVTVTAKSAETGETIGSVDVFVEAGTISEVAVAPDPVSSPATN
jgi:hypothetical protein